MDSRWDIPVVAFIFFGAAVATVTVTVAPEYFVRIAIEEERVELDQAAELANAYRTTLIQVAGGVAILTGLYLTWTKIKVTEDGQVTQRFVESMRLICDDDLTVRLGGYYALARIANSSEKDFIPIIIIFKYKIKNMVETKDGSTQKNSNEEANQLLSIIGNRQKHYDRLLGKTRPPWWLTLSNCNFNGAYLRGRSLQGMVLRKCNFSSVNLEDATLKWTVLSSSIMRGSCLARADLNKASLKHVDLQHADLRGANFSETSLEGVDLSGADLRDARNLNVEDLRLARSLYNCKIDPKLHQKISQSCPELLEA